MHLLIANLVAYSHYVSREFAWIMRELIHRYEWRHLEPSALADGPGMLAEKIQRRLGMMPSLILFWEGESFVCSLAREIDRLPCRKWFFVDDLHHRDRWEARRKASLLCDTVLATYADRLPEFFPDLERSRRIVWLPHSASPDFQLKANVHPANRLLLSGAIGPAYPMRMRLRGLLADGFDGILRLQHPGYHCEYDYEIDPSVGPQFSRKIWECRAAFTDCLVHRYAIAKHFEIPATGALLVADAAIQESLEKLGFLPGVHYFPVSSEDLEHRLRYLFCEEHHAGLDRIRRNGQELVLERHRTSHRARLINDLAIQDGPRNVP
jgi:Glycosyl transferases group 1